MYGIIQQCRRYMIDDKKTDAFDILLELGNFFKNKENLLNELEKKQTGGGARGALEPTKNRLGVGDGDLDSLATFFSAAFVLAIVFCASSFFAIWNGSSSIQIDRRSSRTTTPTATPNQATGSVLDLSRGTTHQKRPSATFVRSNSGRTSQIG